MKYWGLLLFLVYYSIGRVCCSVKSLRLGSHKYYFPCVPVMGVGVVSDPQNFLLRLVKSIDFCVYRFVLIRSSYVDLQDSIDLLRRSNHIKVLSLITYNYSISSVAESWNIILRSFPKEPWYLICAYDVEFASKQLKTFSRRFWEQSGWRVVNRTLLLGESSINIAFSNWRNMEPSGYNLFALSLEVINEVGFFDENIFPVC